MTKVENKFFDFLRKNILLIGLACVTVFGLLIRICGFDFVSWDFRSFLSVWWDEIYYADTEILAKQVGNYNIPYQLLIFVFSRFADNGLYAYKAVSVFFDLALSVGSALLAYELCGRKSKLVPFLTYSITFCSITVILNSSFWAQCDSIYVSFIIFSLFFLLREKTIPSFVLLALAFTFKLQFVFILPFYLFYYVLTRKFSVIYFLIIPVVDIIFCLPAILFGRGFGDIFKIYVDQSNVGTQIQMNCPNLYAFLCNGLSSGNFYLLKNFAILLTVAVLGVMLVLLIYKRVDFSDRRILLLTAVWTVFTCIVFLPSMHERYAYLLDILVIIYAVVYQRDVWVALVCNMASLCGYSHYLFSYDVLDLKWVTIFYLAAYAYVTYSLLKDVATVKVRKLGKSKNT